MFKKMAPALFAILADVARELAGVIGVGLVVYGVSLLSKPAAFIVAGVLLTAGVLLLSRTPSKKTDD